MVALLLSAGVEIDDEEELEEEFMTPEPLERHAGGPPLCPDDILAFHFLLQDDDALDQALQQLR